MTKLQKHPDLLIRTEEPLNAGPPPQAMLSTFITPSPLFFVRNHGTIPQIDPAPFRLTIDGLVNTPLTLSLEDIREQFSSHSVTATLQCAGNRRNELIAVKPIPGEVAWGFEAISTAVWRGIRLRDLLLAAGIQPAAQHAAFLGLDSVERHGQTFGFGGSIPITKALSDEVLVAYEMNGAPLPDIHGAPLRIVAPGYIGARSVKWLSKITLQTEPSTNYFQAHAYKRFSPEIDARNVDWAQGETLGPLELNALIISPQAGEHLPVGPLHVCGLALPAAGSTLTGVELSVDDGHHWQPVTLLPPAEQWSWQFWETSVTLSAGHHTLIVRAWDSSGIAQPAALSQIWNFKGYMNNAWHRVPLLVEEQR